MHRLLVLMQGTLHVRTTFSPILNQKSSICRAAIHAGVIQSESGGYLDAMPADKRRQYSGSYQNGITSERYQEQLEMLGNEGVCFVGY